MAGIRENPKTGNIEYDSDSQVLLVGEKFYNPSDGNSYFLGYRPGGAATANLELARKASGAFTKLFSFMSNGTLKFFTAASKIVPGATTFSIRNNADNADNLLISDAGLVTLRNGLLVTGNGVTVTGGALAATAGATLSGFFQFGNEKQVDKAVNYSINADCSDSGVVFTSGTDNVVFTLPNAAAGLVGYTVTIVNTADDGTALIEVDPDNSDLIKGAQQSGGAGKKFSNTKATQTKGDMIQLVCNGVDTWMVTAIRGTWATES